MRHSANDSKINAVEGDAGPQDALASVPAGHVGPVLLSATGRTVWWTGRVAIGLRYEPPRWHEAQGVYAEWLQDVLLHTPARAA